MNQSIVEEQVEHEIINLAVKNTALYSCWSMPPVKHDNHEMAVEGITLYSCMIC
jgi:hypothetical protein